MKRIPAAWVRDGDTVRLPGIDGQPHDERVVSVMTNDDGMRVWRFESGVVGITPAARMVDVVTPKEAA